MNTHTLSGVTTDLIAAYAATAHNMIHVARAGSERVAGFLERRWDEALEQSSPQLTAEVRRNAANARKVVGGYFSRSVALTTSGADTVVDQIVRIAGEGVGQVAANASLFEEKTGLTTLQQIAQAAVPAAVAVTRIASQVEQKSGELAGMIAGEPAARVSPFRKARNRRAA